MTRLIWSDPAQRVYETGIDRGVLYPRTSPAVVWNGLTGVDESGADDATAYYLDGRPYVIVPQPKEFVGTIKAFTYPDELSPFIGIAEAADGMYLDSQMGDQFDLSYRTFVGNAIQGNNFGYKIHLIYNVMLSPQDLSYESVSDNVNPVDMSWNIQATPTHLEGYRSTAHVMIDTRHVDAERLAEVEALLYGDDSNPPPEALPDLQSIYDLLHYGAGVEIIDHGDGTWEARGSYKYITMLDAVTYSITGAVVQDQGDGTYLISSST